MKKHVLFRFFTWIMVNMLLLGLIVVLLGYVGIWDMSRYLDQLSHRLFSDSQEQVVQVDDLLLLETQELEKKTQNLALREELLRAREVSLQQMQKSYQSMMLQLKVKSQQLQLREQKLQEVEQKKQDRGKNIKDIAQKVRNMRPSKAIERLEGLDILLVIDIFRQMDEDAREQGQVSMVSYLLSEMSKEKAQEIIRMQSRFPRKREDGDF